MDVRLIASVDVFIKSRAFRRGGEGIQYLVHSTNLILNFSLKQISLKLYSFCSENKIACVGLLVLAAKIVTKYVFSTYAITQTSKI